VARLGDSREPDGVTQSFMTYGYERLVRTFWLIGSGVTVHAARRSPRRRRDDDLLIGMDRVRCGQGLNPETRAARPSSRSSNYTLIEGDSASRVEQSIASIRIGDLDAMATAISVSRFAMK